MLGDELSINSFSLSNSWHSIEQGMNSPEWSNIYYTRGGWFTKHRMNPITVYFLSPISSIPVTQVRKRYGIYLFSFVHECWLHAKPSNLSIGRSTSWLCLYCCYAGTKEQNQEHPEEKLSWGFTVHYRKCAARLLSCLSS